MQHWSPVILGSQASPTSVTNAEGHCAALGCARAAVPHWQCLEQEQGGGRGTWAVDAAKLGLRWGGNQGKVLLSYEMWQREDLPARVATCAISAAFCTHLICTIKGARMILPAFSSSSPDENAGWGSRYTTHWWNFVLKLTPWGEVCSEQTWSKTSSGCYCPGQHHGKCWT